VAANEVADVYIRAVDRFLRDHPGALPELGTRNWVADKIGIQNVRNAPWCADWAQNMVGAMQQGVLDGELPTALHIISFSGGQAYDPGRVIDLEHNFLIVRPRGYEIQFSQVGGNFVDPVILLFDPWRELLPRAYAPIPWTVQPRRAPTNTFPRLGS